MKPYIALSNLKKLLVYLSVAIHQDDHNIIKTHHLPDPRSDKYSESV